MSEKHLLITVAGACAVVLALLLAPVIWYASKPKVPVPADCRCPKTLAYMQKVGDMFIPAYNSCSCSGETCACKGH